MNPRRQILASHLVLHGYGHWLSNDPRGSGSDSIRKEELKSLGEIHPGRKRVQPPRADLRNFYRTAEPLLAHEPIWFRDKMRAVVGDAIGSTARQYGYGIWSFSVCSNHAHAVAERIGISRK